jgi:hypothetical protein
VGGFVRILEAVDDPFLQVRLVVLGEQHFRKLISSVDVSMGRSCVGGIHTADKGFFMAFLFSDGGCVKVMATH